MNTNKLIKKAENLIISSRYLEAVVVLDKLIINDQKNIFLLSLRSEAYLRSEQYERALPDLATIVGIDNKNITALNNFGVALLKCKNFIEAKEILEYLIELQPNNLDARINLCNVFQALGKPEKALKSAFAAIELNLTSSPAFNNLGTALGELSMVNEAREAYLTALDLDPKYIPSIINLAEIEAKFENYLHAIQLFESALKMPELTQNERDLINYYVSYSYLSTGRLEEGWDHYEYGFNLLLPKGAARSSRKFVQAQWDGNLMGEGRLLIWTEQGVGDEILFSTILDDFKSSSLEIILECDLRMVELYKRKYPKFQVRPELLNKDRFALLNDFDSHCSFGSLSRFLRRSFIKFPSKINSFILDVDIDKDIKNKLKPLKNKKLVGICWRSGMLTVERNSNYTSLMDWGPIFNNSSEFNFINLQYGECENEIIEAEKKFNIEIYRWSDLDLKNNLDSVFSLISNLDFVISVGTAVCAMSGAMNIKTYLMMKNSWTLLGQTECFPWFPSIKPYISKPMGHVAELIAQVANDLSSND
jgi:tetratricopeptide (TPR) repeat protein